VYGLNELRPWYQEGYVSDEDEEDDFSDEDEEE
jgi:hypothetical protein